MGFLIAEILGLLALAAIGGGAFVYWWFRRRFVDVSAEHEHFRAQLVELEGIRRARSEADARVAALESENEQLRARLSDELAWRSAVQEKIDLLAPPSLVPVMERIAALEGTIAELENTDVSGIESQLAAVAASVGAIKSTDVAPIERRIAAVDNHVQTLRNTDLSGVDARFKALTETVSRIERRIPPEPDLSGISKRLGAIEEALRAARTVPPETRPQKARTARKTAKPASTRKSAPARKKARTPGGNLLKSPKHGKPDDLKRITGVGPKLERMLNNMGVYYFWQVSDWQKSDVEFVDNRLTVFKGRIERDHWVEQAGSLVKETGTTTPPSLKA